MVCLLQSNGYCFFLSGLDLSFFVLFLNIQKDDFMFYSQLQNLLFTITFFRLILKKNYSCQKIVNKGLTNNLKSLQLLKSKFNKFQQITKDNYSDRKQKHEIKLIIYNFNIYLNKEYLVESDIILWKSIMQFWQFKVFRIKPESDGYIYISC